MSLGNLLFVIFAPLFGLAAGSFLNVCIYRIPKGEFWSRKRSFCPVCGTRLSWYETVPLVSFVFLRGKCRHCGARISLRYPLVELLTAVLWGCAAYRFGLCVNAFVYMILFAALIAETFMDLDTKEIPDGVAILILLLSVPLFFTDRGTVWWQRLAGAAAVSVPFYVISLATHGGIGGGDIKLFFALGAVLGLWKVLICALLGVVSAGIVGIALLASKKAKKGYELPLGPFIALGAVLTVFLGDELTGAFRLLFGM